MYQLCRHIMPNGVRCKSPALRGTPYCYFHTRLHRLALERASGNDQPLNFSVLEDRSAIQIAVGQVLSALASNTLEPRRASLLLYGLKIASQNVQRSRNILQVNAEPFATQTPDGEYLAPVENVCSDNDDCSACPLRAECDNCDEVEEEA